VKKLKGEGGGEERSLSSTKLSLKEGILSAVK
jgi:hypothetical protein